MNTLLDLTAPLIVTAACVLALYKGVDIFAAMTDGAKKGLRVMADILPALLVLFPVIYLLRASGLPELLERLLAPAAVMIGSSETTLYVVAVYFTAAGVKDSRWAIPAALCADLACFLSSAWICRILWG